MCGRYAIHATSDQVAQTLGLAEPPPIEPSFNIPPGTRQWVAHSSAHGEVVLETLWWGYRPVWADESAPQPINARAEKVASSPFFRDAFARYRCVIPASGWFEWQSQDGQKQPYYVSVSEDLLLFTGIYDPPREGSEGCFAIITQPAAKPIAHIHPRMPVVLDTTSLEGWLDPSRKDRNAVKAATRPIDPAGLRAWPVDSRVNRPANDDPELIRETPQRSDR